MTFCIWLLLSYWVTKFLVTFPLFSCWLLSTVSSASFLFVSSAFVFGHVLRYCLLQLLFSKLTIIWHRYAYISNVPTVFAQWVRVLKFLPSMPWPSGFTFMSLSSRNSRNDSRKHFFSEGVIAPFNSLPTTADSFRSFSSLRRFLNSTYLPGYVCLLDFKLNCALAVLRSAASMRHVCVYFKSLTTGGFTASPCRVYYSLWIVCVCCK